MQSQCSIKIDIDDIIADYLTSGDISNVVSNVEKITYGSGLCPYSYGPGVYTSRAFLRAFNHEISFNDIEECGEIEPRNSSASDLNYDSVLIYPNPSYPNAIIHLDGGIGLKEIIICDVFGSTVSKYSSLKGINKFDFKLNTPGVYFVKLQSINLATHVFKLIIIE